MHRVLIKQWGCTMDVLVILGHRLDRLNDRPMFSWFWRLEVQGQSAPKPGFWGELFSRPAEAAFFCVLTGLLLTLCAFMANTRA